MPFSNEKKGVTKNKSQFSWYPVTYFRYKKRSLITKSLGKNQVRPLTSEGTELPPFPIAILGDATSLLVDCNRRVWVLHMKYG